MGEVKPDTRHCPSTCPKQGDPAIYTVSLGDLLVFETPRGHIRGRHHVGELIRPNNSAEKLRPQNKKERPR